MAAMIDPQFFYVSSTVRETSDTLLSGIREQKGLLLVTGESGIGKTALLRHLVDHFDHAILSLLVDLTDSALLTFDAFLDVLCHKLELAHDEPGRLRKLQALTAYFIARAAEGRTTVLLIDDAHNLNDEALGSLRLLIPVDNLSDKPLLQIVLAGRPEIDQRLAQPQLRPLRQRIARRCRLTRWKERDIELFMLQGQHSRGDLQAKTFTPEAVHRIALYSQGLPRLIEVFYNLALIAAKETSQQPISAAIVDSIAPALPTLQQLPQTVPIPSHVSAPSAWKRFAPVSVILTLLTLGLFSSWRLMPFSLDTGVKFSASVSEQPPPVMQHTMLAPPVSTQPPPASQHTMLAPSAILPAPSREIIEQTASEADRKRMESEKKRPAIPPPPSPPVLVITKAHPTISTPKLVEGKPFTFTIEAVSTHPEPLRYLWLVDGQERGQGPRWTYRPRFDEGGVKQKEITVRIMNQDNLTIERTWEALVQNVNRPPLITAVFPPTDRLELTASEERRFAIEAVDPDAHDQLTIVWSLDGQEVARGRDWKLALSTAPRTRAQHRVTVEVSDRERLRTRAAWEIVLAKPSNPPPPVVAALPTNIQSGTPLPTAETPTTPLIGEDEVRTWLASSKQAWEKKDVNALVHLGVVAQQNAEQVQRLLAEYNSFQVALQNVAIHIYGNRAEVSFSRIDTVDGRTFPHPGRKRFLLDRKTDGQLTALRETPKP